MRSLFYLPAESLLIEVVELLVSKSHPVDYFKPTNKNSLKI